jgi:redox-sensitive bicupin YhaK (pirin superfamily)
MNKEIAMIQVHKSNQRGYADHGWLRSFHSFSFADYYDEKRMGFGPLRVINEVRDLEIISYVLVGELEHKDSMGNGSVIRPGDVQRMSAGTGVRHSEFNPSKSDLVHFLQIWIEPSVTGIAPGYEEKRFGPEEKRGRLRLIASPDGSQGSVTIHQDARVHAALIDGAESATLPLDAGRRAYVHVARGSANVNGVALGAGDALQATGAPKIDIDHGVQAEVLVFDLPSN